MLYLYMIVCVYVYWLYRAFGVISGDDDINFGNRLRLLALQWCWFSCFRDQES